MNPVKYARTFHLPWSPGATDDDKMMKDISAFEGREVVVTAKMDGENTTMYSDYLHARSLDYSPHASRSWIKALHSTIAHEIPLGYRICGENLYAKHSIGYEHLEDLFLVFSVWNEENVCLSWDQTLIWSGVMGLKTVPELYRGVWNESLIRKLYQPSLNGDPLEGYVVRLADSFHYSNFRRYVGKYVRINHVQTDTHWKHAEVVPNKVRI